MGCPLRLASTAPYIVRCRAGYPRLLSRDRGIHGVMFINQRRQLFDAHSCHTGNSYKASCARPG